MNKKKDSNDLKSLDPDDVNPFANIKVKKKTAQKKGKAKERNDNE